MDITKPNIEERLWKFAPDVKKDIFTLTALECLKASFHAKLKIKKYIKKDAYSCYVLRICDEEKKKKKHLKRKERYLEAAELFATKLDFLEERAEQLNMTIPNSLDDIKLKIKQIEHDSISEPAQQQTYHQDK